MRNNSINLVQILASGSEGDVVKTFLIWSSGGLRVQWSKTIYAILNEGIMGNIQVKLYASCTSGSGGDVVKEKSYGQRTTEDARRTMDEERLQYLTLNLSLR